jgi:hypothetical protein
MKISIINELMAKISAVMWRRKWLMKIRKAGRCGGGWQRQLSAETG